MQISNIPSTKLTRWYIAGPLFNPYERAEAEWIASIIEGLGFETFVPHRSGFLCQDLLKEFSWQTQAMIERDNVVPYGTPEEQVNYFVFCIDVYNVVKRCQGIIFSCNGLSPDAGAISEAAIAWTLGLPVILYKSDSRSLILGQDNPLITGLQTFTKTAYDGESLVRTLLEYNNWEVQNLYSLLNDEKFNPKYFQINRVVRLGEKFWDLTHLPVPEMIREVYKVVNELTGADEEFLTPLSLLKGKPHETLRQIIREEKSG
jgi:nucleoside 2-deoxyribosyltransferase